MLNGHVEVGDGLCLNALRGVDHEKASFAGGNASRHFVGKVNVSRSVDEVKTVCFATTVVFHLNGMTFNRDASLTLQVHVVEHLPFCYLNCFGVFKQAVGEGALAMINVGYDTEIAYILHEIIYTCLVVMFRLYVLWFADNHLKIKIDYGRWIVGEMAGEWKT